ncbi:hypothetical protein [Planctopirus hydrillae]|uniref:Uncharacterized protein n=1 Tax=Planctopirus hydrillae TaxID=1841610 RepID=A0A1C3ETP3_9PLAN|nr:hypothetical protein [Planctopirus hydrillae]ODA36616.1 hypothetical protein A6X21_15905 [Planctopirus hydrillae]
MAPGNREDERPPNRDEIQSIVFALIWDKVYDVRHLDGVGGTNISHGKLKYLDQDGFVVLEGPDGNVILIPKDRIIDIKQVPKTS